uniref:Putative secreted protein n=1 Tax=Anopheles darlingi TaxID=43151 RepID=A0A2M4D7Q3_ANODA
MLMVRMLMRMMMMMMLVGANHARPGMMQSVVVERSTLTTNTTGTSTAASESFLQQTVPNEPVVQRERWLKIATGSQTDLLPLQTPLGFGFHLQLDRRVVANLLLGRSRGMLRLQIVLDEGTVCG